jgi:hypothetical protein
MDSPDDPLTIAADLHKLADTIYTGEIGDLRPEAGFWMGGSGTARQPTDSRSSTTPFNGGRNGNRNGRANGTSSTAKAPATKGRSG